MDPEVFYAELLQKTSAPFVEAVKARVVALRADLDQQSQGNASLYACLRRRLESNTVTLINLCNRTVCTGSYASLESESAALSTYNNGVSEVQIKAVAALVNADDWLHQAQGKRVW
jgi:type IV secretory pathway VirB4 component